MARITLCMIVRDEESMLGGCLDSARGVVDDMVVVDTGSRDATKEVARERGARVFDFTWCDDFAAARNAALRHAHGDWVLQLDADERLTPESAPRIRSAVAHAQFDAALLKIHDASRVDADVAAVLSGAARLGEIQLVMRLLRRTSDLRYVDAIHENVLPWCRRRGTKVTALDVDLVHLGAIHEVVADKKKIERNARLLRARIEKDPTDIAAYGYLSNEYLRAMDLDAAYELTELGWAQEAIARQRKVSMHRLAVARAYVLLPRRRFDDVRATVAVARSIDGENPDFTYMEAFTSELEARVSSGVTRRELLAQARDGYRAALGFAGRVFSSAFVHGASGWVAATRLGTVQLLLDDPVEALRSFDRALEIRPSDREALLGRAEAMIVLGDPGGALQRIERMLDGSPDAWTLAAMAVRALGRRDDSILFARQARTLVEKGFVAPHRRDRLVQVVGQP